MKIFIWNVDRFFFLFETGDVAGVITQITSVYIVNTVQYCSPVAFGLLFALFQLLACLQCYPMAIHGVQIFSSRLPFSGKTFRVFCDLFQDRAYWAQNRNF